MKKLTAELYFAAESLLGEGPVWENGTLYWVDITGKRILVKDDHKDSAQHYDVGIEVGALALWRDDKMLLATEQGFQIFEMASGRLQALGHPEEALPDNRFNDGKCDPCGRFIAGTLNRRGEADKAALYVLDQDRSVRELYRPLTCSNGLAWSESGSTFYHIDTRPGLVRAFHYDLDSGSLSDGRVAIEIPAAHGKPDGMTIDREGNLWIALWGGWGVECWNPASGVRQARIELPVAQVTSCVFGGEHYDTLFITTAKSGLDQASLAAQPLAGSIFSFRPGVSGFAPFHFQSDRCD